MSRIQTSRKINRHKYLKLSPCKCGNTKFKYIKVINKFECTKCKIYREV